MVERLQDEYIRLLINGSRTLNSETLLDGNSVVEGVTGRALLWRC